MDDCTKWQLKSGLQLIAPGCLTSCPAQRPPTELKNQYYYLKRIRWLGDVLPDLIRILIKAWPVFSIIYMKLFFSLSLSLSLSELTLLILWLPKLACIRHTLFFCSIYNSRRIRRTDLVFRVKKFSFVSSSLSCAYIKWRRKQTQRSQPKSLASTSSLQT